MVPTYVWSVNVDEREISNVNGHRWPMKPKAQILIPSQVRKSQKMLERNKPAFRHFSIIPSGWKSNIYATLSYHYV